MGEPVEVDWAAVKRAWRRSGYGEMWLQHRVQGRTVDLSVVSDAVLEANDTLERLVGTDEVDGDVVGGFATDAPGGAVFFLNRATTEPGLRAWLGELATGLASRGLGGTVTGVRSHHLPTWLSGQPPPMVSAFFALNDARIDDAMAAFPATWGIDETFTAEVLDALLSWAHVPNVAAYLRRGLFQSLLREPEAATISSVLARAAVATGMSGVVYAPAQPPKTRMRALECEYGGLMSIRDMDKTRTSREIAESMCDPLVAVADRLRVAFVRHCSTVSGWDNFSYLGPSLPEVPSYQYRINPRLLDSYVPDVHGVQILSTAHLERAHDLTDWHIKKVGDQRHLVTARDLDPWYHQASPTNEALTAGRADFGSMILTSAALADETRT